MHHQMHQPYLNIYYKVQNKERGYKNNAFYKRVKGRSREGGVRIFMILNIANTK
jgi:hypothetical protein